VNANHCGAGYGVVTEVEREAIHMFVSCEGLLLDSVYTGPAAAGMIDLIRTGFFNTNETVLLLRAGGQAALFAEQYVDELKSKRVWVRG
jgi:L-cysteate sulfo-lyase